MPALADEQRRVGAAVGMVGRPSRAQAGLAARISRSVQLGRLGVRLAWARRASGEPSKRKAQQAVAAQMGQLRGLPQKIGQLLSLGELESESPIFSHLTESSQAAPASDAFRWIEDELGVPLDRAFRSLEPRGTAASIGQVHKGTLPDGRTVGVKVQYPDVARGLDTDLAALGWLARPLSSKAASFNLGAYEREMRRGLLEELDYEHERAALDRFASRAREVPGLVTPVPITELCTSRLLTMSWVDGQHFSATTTWPDHDKCEAALVLLRTFLRGCLVWREVHADPHPGNLRFHRTTDGVQVGMLDFGCVASITDADARAFRQLAVDGRAMTASELLETYVDLGFSAALLEPMQHRLPAITHVLFEPFHHAGAYDARTWHLESRLTQALGEDRWNFRFAGPARLIFFIRALTGVVQYVSRLGAPLDWRTELLRLPTTDITPTPGDRDALHTAPRSDIPTGKAPSMASSALKISVTRDGQQVVRLSFAASAVNHLDELVPDAMRENLAARNIDVRMLGREAASNGYQPGQLLSLVDEATTVRVWLE
jgi:predicted unusual protein kinase regulating ubiquinone biosynthesis (AarF/ABC1/UbiB family)